MLLLLLLPWLLLLCPHALATSHLLLGRHLLRHLRSCHLLRCHGLGDGLLLSGGSRRSLRPPGLRRPRAAESGPRIRHHARSTSCS